MKGNQRFRGLKENKKSQLNTMWVCESDLRSEMMNHRNLAKFFKSAYILIVFININFLILIIIPCYYTMLHLEMQNEWHAGTLLFFHFLKNVFTKYKVLMRVEKINA